MRASVLPVLQSHDIESADGYKPSLYNLFVDKGETVWGINFRSMALIRLSRERYRHATRILDGEPSAGEGDHVETLRNDLIKGKFLIPKSLDELELLKTKHWTNRFADNGLTLIIAPTLRCNFACEYCYVDLNANKMKLEDRVKVGKFFERKLPEGKPATIVWTGGDPSLAMDVVEDLSLRFHDICAQKGSSYKASLITNAYLLHDEMRARLRNSKVESLQISLDGSQEFHDKSRYLPGGKPTYDTIMKNVEDTCDEFKIFLRINVDAANRFKIPDLLDDLEARGLSKRLYIYFAHVDNVNENSAGYSESCLSAREYAEAEIDLLRISMERGFRFGGRVLTKPVFTFCGANSMSYYVIDSKANLLKCYHDFGTADQRGIGKIGDDGCEIVTNPYNLMKWLGWDPFTIQECRDCKVLPLCMGGCSHKIMNSGMNIEKGCLKLRFSMEEIVDLFAETVTAQRGISSGCSSCAEAAMSNV
jgi:uncharacterized protein